MFRHSAQVLLREVDGQRAPRRPVRSGSLRLDQPDRCDAVSGRHLRAESSNRVGSRGVQQLDTRDLFLTSKLLTDQFSRYPQGSSRMMGERLSAAELGIRWTNGTRCRENGAVTVEQEKAGVLIGDPSERLKADEAVAAD